jgi:hypothetical protein
LASINHSQLSSIKIITLVLTLQTLGNNNPELSIQIQDTIFLEIEYSQKK